jgi:hypothetical protein
VIRISLRREGSIKEIRGKEGWGVAGVHEREAKLKCQDKEQGRKGPKKRERG